MERIYRGKGMMQITQKIQCLNCLFHRKAMKYHRLKFLSCKEICKFLLEHGIPYILSERFSQDDVENYFSRQGAIGRRRDNPTVRDFSFHDNTIELKYSVRPIAGNIC